MPDPHVWNREKNEMDLLTLGPGADYKYQIDFRLFVAVNGIDCVDGKQVVSVVLTQGNIVKSIIDTIEAESRRLGYVS